MIRGMGPIGLAALIGIAGTLVGARGADEPRAARPNVLLIVTDDQGYGDLGSTGNPVLKTPRLDALASASARFRSFYVSPVCSPTRASLMTGRYNYRTGVVDTFRGRSRMNPAEVTLAETLGSAGYRTGIFGKWHLGDNAPCRAMDQGFAESLVHRGGGIGQGFGSPGGDRYTDPVLLHNGAEERYPGYCTDIFADAAIRFIEADRSRPFFAYLAFNAPHDPLEVPDRYLESYAGFTSASVNPGGGRTSGGEDVRAAARVYAMLASVDENVGRLLDRLDRLGLARDTVVVFLSDNGPAQARFNAGMRGLKQSVHEGGIRVPCFVRWPGKVEPGRVVEPAAAHIDLAPTLLAACGVASPPGVSMDGRDLLPLLEGKAVDWPERVLYFQWHRGDAPESGRAFAVRGPRFKLVQPLGVEPGPLPRPPRYELFDILADPAERFDVADRHPEEVIGLLRGYRAWFAEVAAPRNLAVPPIRVGSPGEDPITLTRQDWRGPATAWQGEDLGGWDVDVVRGGVYDLTLLHVAGPAGLVRFELGATEARAEAAPGARSTSVGPVTLARGPARLRARIERPAGIVGVYQVVLRRRG